MTPNGSQQGISPDIFSTDFLLGNVGAPFLVGMAVGFFAKKVSKIAILVGGALLVMLFLAESWDLITVKDGAVLDVAAKAAGALKETGTLLTERLKVMSTQGGSAIAGFFVGLKAG